MLQVRKLERLGSPVPLLAAFPFEIRIGDLGGSTDPSIPGQVEMGKRDYCTCVEEESIGGFLSPSKKDVKKDD